MQQGIETCVCPINAEHLKTRSEQMHMTHQPVTLSQNLCVNAYKKAQSNGAYQSRTGAVVQPVKAQANRAPVTAGSRKTTKELKVSVLSSLQSQSNAGTVKIRDVAVALDRILKKS
ncbi:MULTISPECIES: hypothetical protein [unclassified Sulfitobacter]|uniref:hypothetical protein n=1 Tax=unclassified Sulfitobacter TaxID=196795 RepID=UPI0023E226F5|nr:MULTISPECIES: hypothetical protein [unclassified Sulfitobacter]MDF3415459.1 hypothetical protein [Sulfitobacter sp. KE5]MDF3490689.1 hypothetical protein [Sulfitobacter sp. M60]MDF3494593.1 hypothetical protein [Sulfitobacter sp. M51]MDF3502402.1 hypothetical protein [Sulfitobacter sp. Ks17]MDF3529699.1 hypothetical protein [Sulfitobacter sp. M77]MDF3533606.1 hypothetical protein [Sulfitobacter sp. S62]